MKAIRIIREILAYLFACKMVVFGVAKILGTQFRIPPATYETRLKDLSGFELMWGFFARNYEFSLMIGLVELLVALFVVFPRTRLFGLMMAVPIYANLLAMNILFEVKFAIAHTIFDAVLVGFLLYPYRKDLFNFFYRNAGRMAQEQDHWHTGVMRKIPWLFAGFLVPLYIALMAYIVLT